MSKLIRGLVMFGTGVGVGMYWPQIRDEILPRLAGTQKDPAESTASAEAL